MHPVTLNAPRANRAFDDSDFSMQNQKIAAQVAHLVPPPPPVALPNDGWGTFATMVAWWDAVSHAHLPRIVSRDGVQASSEDLETLRRARRYQAFGTGWFAWTANLLAGARRAVGCARQEHNLRVVSNVCVDPATGDCIVRVNPDMCTFESERAIAEFLAPYLVGGSGEITFARVRSGRPVDWEERCDKRSKRRGLQKKGEAPLAMKRARR